MRHNFKSFAAARKFVRALKLSGQNEWREFIRSGKKPQDIPSNPARTYGDQWISYGDWFGTNRIANQNMKFLPYLEALQLVRPLNLKNREEYNAYRKKMPKCGLPSIPERTYEADWVHWGDFLGTHNHKGDWMPFEEARKFVRTLNLKNRSEYAEYCKTKNVNIPNYPDECYENSGWISWGDFLGNGYIATSNRVYRSFKEAKKYIHNLNIESQSKWKKFCLSGDKPEDIPTDPRNVYKKEWVSFGDWLGTGIIAPQNRVFRRFQEARKFVHALKLSGQNEWREYCKNGDKPDDIPNVPSNQYKEWVSWGDWFGTGVIANQYKEYRPFDKAQQFVHDLEFKNESEWKEYVRSGNKPTDIPATPYRAYKNKGWSSWSDWFGNGRGGRNKCRPFEEARQFVQSLNLKDWNEWLQWCKTDDKPNDIPVNPYSVYKDQGWLGLGDWLGTGVVANMNKVYRSFEEAKQFVYALKLNNIQDWILYCKSGNKPDDIPMNAPQTYKDEWVSWGDFLGTGVVAFQVLSAMRKEKFAKDIELIKDSIHWLPMTAWYYILIANGIEPTNRHMRLLKATQKGKLKLDELVTGVNGDTDADVDEDDIINKLKPNSVQILKLLESPIFAGMDEEAIEAIMSEVKSQLWDRIYDDEDSEIESLRTMNDFEKGLS